jgi:hypothetical protein
MAQKNTSSTAGWTPAPETPSGWTPAPEQTGKPLTTLGGIDPSTVAGANALPNGLPGVPVPNHIQNPLSGMAKTPKDRAVAQQMENSGQQVDNFISQPSSDVVDAANGVRQNLRDWAKQPGSFSKYILQPAAGAINMGAAMINAPFEANVQAMTGHPIEALQSITGSDEAKAQELEKQGNEGGAAWERYGKPVAFAAAGEAAAPALESAQAGIMGALRGTRFQNSNLASIIAPGFKGTDLPQYAAAELTPFYKQEAAAQGLKDENFLQRMFTGDTPSRSTIGGAGPIHETVQGMGKVRKVADGVVDRIDARLNGPKGVMEQAANDPVAPQTKQTIINGLEAEKATASRLGSKFDTAYDALIKQVKEADTYGKLNQIKKDSNNMIEGVLNGGPKENAAMSVEPIIAWKKAGDLIRENMYPDLQRYVAPPGSPGYFSVADTGRLEGQAMSARDGIYANYKEAGHADLPEVAKKYLEGVTEGSLYKTHVIRRMLHILPTPAGEFNKTFRRGIGTLGEGSVPESVTPKEPQKKLPAPMQPPPTYNGEFSVPTAAPVEPTQVTPRLPQQYIGPREVPYPNYTPLSSTSQFQQAHELGTTALTIPQRVKGFPTAVSQGNNATGSFSTWSPARLEANQVGVGHSIPAAPGAQPRNFGKPTPPLRSFTGPETYTASNWQYLTGSAEPPQMIGHNGSAVMTTSDPSIAKSALDGMRSYQDTQGFKKLPEAEQKLHTDALDKLDKQYADYQKWQAKNPLPPRPGVEPKFEVWLTPGKTGKVIASKMKSRVIAQAARIGGQEVVNGKTKASDMTPERQAEQDNIIRNYQPQ